MFLVTAVLRLICLCNLDVQENPHRHITSIHTGPRDCPSEWRFGIRCVCNRNGLSSRLIVTPLVSQQHNFPHVFITGANLVGQAFGDAKAFFHDKITSPFPEDDGKVLPFMQLASLHGKSIKATEGHNAIQPYKASMAFYDPGNPTVTSEVVDLVSLAEMRKSPALYQYTKDLDLAGNPLSESQFKAQIKPPWKTTYTIQGRKIGEPLHLFFVSRSSISQGELNDNLRFTNLSGVKGRRKFSSLVRYPTVKFGLSIQCGVVFHDEFHTQLRGQLSEKERTYLTKAKAVTQTMLQHCFAGFNVYGRIQLASFFPETLRPNVPVVPTVGKALYRIIGPILEQGRLPKASDIENETRVWRVWCPPVFHKINVQGPSAPAPLAATSSQSAAPKTAAASGARVADVESSYERIIRNITGLAKPIRKCLRVAEIYDIITHQARYHLLQAQDRNAGAKTPPWPLKGIVMLDTPAMAFYVAVALQLRDDEEKAPLMSSGALLRPRIQVMFVPAVSRTKEDMRTLAVHWLQRAASSEADANVCKVIVTTFSAAGTGLDGLQNTLSYIIYPLAPLSATAEEQADGRIHRTGQQYEMAKYTITIPSDPYDLLRSYARIKLAIRDGENNISLPLIKELLGPADES
ncbi:hypothetical protein ColTof3_01724 [Colletotrichum tofieldiae]|nr:hypothetical protein ColTof3_01724 [Colletotrichum tofieldiae]